MMRFGVWSLEFGIQRLSIAIMRDEHRVKIKARVPEYGFGVQS